MDQYRGTQLSLAPSHPLHQRDLIPFIPALRSYFVRKTGNLNIVDDLVQDVMLRILARRSTDQIDNPEAYLFRTAANVLRDKARRDSVRKVEMQKNLTESDHPVEECSPDRVIVAREEILRVAAALQELPERTRDIFLMKRFEGLSHAEIAARVGLSVSGIEKQIAKAVAHLARRMSK
ncbi:RNA polymerase sigma-70 factor, ECF subfamily [Sphingobium sp. AP50]|uniref:RNA polymerase sigma factor n=1 Tax=unclassified Sphingobium TaxID=2611147 RepID=UPI0008D2FD5B|nr:MULTISPECIES: sigma-70 family RNA polymerase sigma factor [unclassified Sphingobium]SEI83062.1 RNA polymerase sigma-70 factor, ECF subfamily [Sphingobium sp. AP50]SEQ85504.1 RNA polymerase sigma-70 factor, ECF subfamily [Sphingobium sp. YR768]